MNIIEIPQTINKKGTRLEIWQEIINKMPSLNCFNINGHKGYGYITKSELENIRKQI